MLKYALRAKCEITFTPFLSPLEYSDTVLSILSEKKSNLSVSISESFLLSYSAGGVSGTLLENRVEKEKKRKMASSLEIVRLCASPVSISRHKSPAKSEFRKRVFRLADSGSWVRLGRCVRVHSSALNNGDNQSKGEEPPESLFMKELKRRGMTPTSLLQDYEVDVDEIKTGGKETRNSSKTTATTTPTPAFDQSLLNQRERSLALNSEGLEGLIPRARILLTIGGTFFLAFWPLIVLTLGAFSALYLYFGADFVHDGSRTPVSPPPYIDPYALLEDERISGINPRLN